MKIKLNTPITVDGKAIDEVDIDVDSITGADIMFCVQEAAAIKGVVVSYKIDAEVHLQMVCKLSGIPREILLKSTGRNFNKLVGPVQDFFLGSD